VNVRRILRKCFLSLLNISTGEITIEKTIFCKSFVVFINYCDNINWLDDITLLFEILWQRV
jgi:hypothetical protein